MIDFEVAAEKSSVSCLQERIRQAIEGISSQTLDKVWLNMHARMHYTVKVNGGRIDHDNI